MLEKVSPRSRTLKTFIKMPLLLCVGTSALQSGLTCVFLKLVTELGQAKEFMDNLGLVIIMFACIGISGTMQLHMLNLAMKYYDQIEAIPIYTTAVMIMWIGAALVVFDEIHYYTKL